MPKIVDHDRMRVEIVEAAARVIARVGPERASIRLIGAEAGYSAAAPLHYFESRESLFAFAFRHFSERSITELKKIAQGEGDVHSRVARLVDALLDRSAGDIAFARSMISMVLGADNDSQLKAVDVQTYVETTRLVRVLLAEAQEAGLIPADADLDAETGLLVSVADGLAVAAITMGRGASNVEEKVKPMIRARLGLEKRASARRRIGHGRNK